METAAPKIHKNLLLILIMLTSFINPFMGAAVNIALPQIGGEFSMNAVTMSWVAMSFLLASAVVLVPMGKLADMFGRKKIFLWGNGVVVMASLMCAFSTSTSMLLIFRAIQGIGGAMMFGTSMAIVTSAFPPHERGKAIGMNVTAVYLGLSAAPVLGGFLTQSFGWQSLFVLPIPIGLLVLFATPYAVKQEWADARHEQFDLKGSLIYIASMSAFMYGFSKIPDNFAIACTVAGLAGLLFFIRVEWKAQYPVLDMKLFAHNRLFAMSNLAALINYATTFAITFIISLYLQYVKGFSPREAGTILVAQPIMMAIVATFSGRMSDRYDSRILSSMGMTIIAVGLCLLLPINDSTSNGYIVAALLILGIGFGLFSSPNTNAIMSSVEKRYLGIASATVGTMRLTGQMMSMGIATLVLHLFIGNDKINPSNHIQFLHASHLTIGVFIALSILGIWASLARGKRENVKD
ncbi:MFS transporter [Williamwhitmania taraxaci]|uniref:Drug resistance transporter, EmrB/QacA subfamily n=1 Tax=Williamwhitmania taraxaci TaxID=1640674 RepID=A0A1G6MP61_9BACT|nr:MFS transporter [Williamwhitmania taraxaci]SDC57292.1 drug resistance transporter, EmrB/QacA subfamily [Williamwhitmania taraxaci]